MKLKVLGSSSSGNGYILENDKEALVIEAGINISKVKEAVDFNLRKICCCLVSHEHNDHAGHIQSYMDAGITVYSSKGTFKAKGIKSHRAFTMEANKKVQIGNFKVVSFKVEHDCAEPFGFLIHHPETGNILFATDTKYLRYRFENLNNILIEANYSTSIIDDHYINGLHPAQRARIINSHMSLEACKGVLKANDLSKVNNIVLIHLSDGNSHAREFQREIELLTGKTVHVADSGLTINFNASPF
jgi:phosphoribosyl 1,2-cyclic phosphodiesterase